MNFAYSNLGHLRQGQVVEVTLSGNAANVRLMDSSNFSSYKSGRRHRYYGGHATRSPVRIPVPNAGNWYVAVDFGGLAGNARWGARVLDGALPAMRAPALADVPSLVREHPPLSTDDGQAFDVFISHASEDKDDVVRELAHALRARRLSVWYDEFSLHIGDSLRRKIDQGLARSRVGLVVLSPSFIAKGWTNYELDGIVTRAVTGEQVLLPIWHKLTKQEVVNFSPSLADKLARSTATSTIDEIATEIAGLLQGAAG
jgi:hypothetical protein